MVPPLLKPWVALDREFAALVVCVGRATTEEADVALGVN